MKVAQCFRCSRWVDAEATQEVDTIDGDASTAPPVKRLWCVACLAQVRLDTNEALSEIQDKEHEEDEVDLTQLFNTGDE